MSLRPRATAGSAAAARPVGPDNSRLASLIQLQSTGDQRFAELWACGAVRAHREVHKIVEHPAVGPITVDCDVLTDGDAELNGPDRHPLNGVAKGGGTWVMAPSP